MKPLNYSSFGDILTTADVARLLKCSDREARRVMREELPSRKVGGKLLVAKSKLVEWMERPSGGTA